MHYYFPLSLIAQKRLIYFADGGEKPAEAEIVSSGVNDDRPNVAQLEKTIQEKKRSLDEKLATFGGNTQEVADELDRIWQQHVSYLNDAESQAESARRGHLQSTLTALDRLEQIVVEARQSFQQVRQGAIAHVDLGQSGGRVEAPAEATTSFPTSDPVPEPIPVPTPSPTPSDDASIPKIEPEAPSPDPLEVHQEDNGLEGNVAKEEEMTLEREERLHALPGLGGRPWRRQVVSVEHEEEPAPEESLELTADYQDVLSSLDAQELERMPVEQLIERMGKALKAIEQKMAALNVGDDVKAHFQQLIKSHQDRLIPMMSVTPGFSFDVHSGLSLRDPAKVKPVVLEVLSVIDSFNKELDVLGSSVPDLQKRIQAGEIFRVDVGRTGASGVGVADEVKAEQPPARPVVADNPVVQALQGGALGAIAAGEAVSEGKAPLVGDISGDKSGSVGVEKPDAVLPVAVPEAKAVYQPATPEERKAFLSDDGTIKLEDRGHEIRETVHSILSAKEEGGDLPEQVTVSYAERGKTRLEALARRKPQYQPLLDYVNSSDNRVVATKTGGDYVFDLPDGRKLHVPIWNGDKVVAGTEESGVAGEAGAVLEEASIAPVEEPTKSLANASPGPSTDIAEMRIDKSLFDELQGFKDRYYVSTHNRGTDFVFLDRRTGEELGVIPTDGLAKEDFEASLRSKMAEIQTVLDAKKPERLIEDQQTAMQQMIARILPKKFSTPNYPRDMMRALWNAGYRHSAEKPLELHIDAGASRLTVMLEGRIFSIKNQPDANRAFYDILAQISGAKAEHVPLRRMVDQELNGLEELNDTRHQEQLTVALGEYLKAKGIDDYGEVRFTLDAERIEKRKLRRDKGQVYILTLERQDDGGNWNQILKLSGSGDKQEDAFQSLLGSIQPERMSVPRTEESVADASKVAAATVFADDLPEGAGTEIRSHWQAIQKSSIGRPFTAASGRQYVKTENGVYYNSSPNVKNSWGKIDEATTMYFLLGGQMQLAEPVGDYITALGGEGSRRYFRFRVDDALYSEDGKPLERQANGVFRETDSSGEESRYFTLGGVECDAAGKTEEQYRNDIFTALKTQFPDIAVEEIRNQLSIDRSYVLTVEGHEPFKIADFGTSLFKNGEFVVRTSFRAPELSVEAFRTYLEQRATIMDEMAPLIVTIERASEAEQKLQIYYDTLQKVKALDAQLDGTRVQEINNFIVWFTVETQGTLVPYNDVVAQAEALESRPDIHQVDTLMRYYELAGNSDKAKRFAREMLNLIDLIAPQALALRPKKEQESVRSFKAKAQEILGLSSS